MVQIAKIYPTIFALLALSSKVCRKAASPICENIHPIATITRSAGDVLLKKFIFNTKLPKRKKIKLVTKARRKLKIA